MRFVISYVDGRSTLAHGSLEVAREVAQRQAHGLAWSIGRLTPTGVQHVQSGGTIPAPLVLILGLVDAGREHVARELYGDKAVTGAIRADLEAQGLDPDEVFRSSNGWGA